MRTLLILLLLTSPALAGKFVQREINVIVDDEVAYIVEMRTESGIYYFTCKTDHEPPGVLREGPNPLMIVLDGADPEEILQDERGNSYVTLQWAEICRG